MSWSHIPNACRRPFASQHFSSPPLSPDQGRSASHTPCSTDRLAPFISTTPVTHASYFLDYHGLSLPLTDINHAVPSSTSSIAHCLFLMFSPYYHVTINNLRCCYSLKTLSFCTPYAAAPHPNCPIFYLTRPTLESGKGMSTCSVFPSLFWMFEEVFGARK